VRPSAAGHPEKMSTSLRIALVLNPFSPRARGGAHASALARELLGRGHTVRGFGAPPSTIPRSGAEPDPDGLAPAAHSAGVSGFHPDVVIAYEALSPAAFAGARAARRCAVPLVLVESGLAVEGRLRERALRRVGERLWGRYVRRAAARLIALDPVARDLALREGFAAGRVLVVPAGVDLEQFRPGLTSGLSALHRVRGRVMLYAGRLADGHGLEVLIEAFARTVGQRADWSLVLAGDGPARPRLRALVGRLGIGASVCWTGRPRPEELPGLMSGSTLLVLPAVDDSVRGRQIPRALACGLPVIASDLPHFRFLVEHDGSGLLVAPGDAEAWVAALSRAATAPEARKRWRVRARELAQTRLAWPGVCAEIESILLAARAERERPSRARSQAGPAEGIGPGEA